MRALDVFVELAATIIMTQSRQLIASLQVEAVLTNHSAANASPVDNHSHSQICARKGTAMTIAGVGAGAGAGPSDLAWGIACKRCDGLLARHSQLAFLLENATAVHLTLNKRLLHDEQLQAPEGEGESESWRIYSRADVLPELQFTKIRTKNAFKRERLPFELCCVRCDAKVASEGFLDELDESQLLLDSKACACVLDRQTPYGMAGDPKARKWGSSSASCRR